MESSSVETSGVFTTTPEVLVTDPTLNVLDKGVVSLLSSQIDGDLIIVNAARVSFGRFKKHFDPNDARLIEYLVKNRHDSPLRHVQLSFRIKAPEFVMRQWYKHVVGISYTEQREIDHAWNEISGRYVEYRDFYYPEVFRKQSSDRKQGTDSEEVEEAEQAREIYAKATEHSFEAYKRLIELGVGKEIARAILPLNYYTEVIWTASLQAILNFIDLRDSIHAQEEIRVYAKAVGAMVEKVAPITLSAWKTHRSR